MVQDQTSKGAGYAILWNAAYRFVAVRKSAIEIALIVPNFAAIRIGVRLGSLWIELDRFVAIRKRAIGVVLV